jgi:cytochrome c peroxidase
VFGERSIARGMQRARRSTRAIVRPEERSRMIRFASPVVFFLVMSCNASRPLSEDTQATESTGTGTSPADDFVDPPPNTPPPPASCGDMNGGGDEHVDFPALFEAKVAEKPAAMERQLALLEARYDLSDRPGSRTMTGGKPIQEGVRVRLPEGIESWEELASLTPEEIKERDVFPRGFMALPHPKQPEGGMLFPHFAIEETLRQTGRDLTRFDLDFDLPDPFLPEFPPPIFLTTRPDLGDVSQGQLVTTDNYFELFKCILNPKQLDGLRLLLTPFPQQQFNNIDDRRSERPSLGVACFDCHTNGHTNAGTHLVGDIRPQEFRHRIDSPSLRGVNVQQIFGSQRALMSIEDFTEFEQRAAYFDGDPVLATKKGVNPLDRGLQVHHMAEFQKILDFPPAPKLGLDGRLDPSQASRAERRGEAIFFGKGRCATCHTLPYYTDNSFYEPRMINGIMATAEGPIKTFTLRGIKDTPPYFHDGRLLTLEDTIEFFNIVLELGLSEREKADLLAFLFTL